MTHKIFQENPNSRTSRELSKVDRRMAIGYNQLKCTILKPNVAIVHSKMIILHQQKIYLNKS